MNYKSELRDKIISILYQINIYEEINIEYNIDKLISDMTEEDNEFINDCIKGVLDNKKDIIELANKYLKDWDFSRLSKVDQAILLLSIFEMIYYTTPSVVAIDEAIELSKKYSDEAVTKMINGVLDSIYHEVDKK